MATVRAYSVCQSDVEAGQNRRSATVYSYSPSVGLQDGSALTPDGTPAEDAYRTGLSQAYCHGGAATADADADGQYMNTGGITPTLINGNTGGTAATFPANTGAATDLTLTTAGTGNAALPNCARVVCSTTNISPDDMGAGLIVVVSTNATGVPALLGTSSDSVLEGGNGYANGDTDVVALDGFPGCTLTVTV